jgi:hypothetical protein
VEEAGLLALREGARGPREIKRNGPPLTAFLRHNLIHTEPTRNADMMHPVEHLAFWKTPAAEVRAMADAYDALVAGDPVLKQRLDALLSWARSEALCDEEFSRSDY